MHDSVVERTQIYLSEEDGALLARAARRTGASRSELIRRAIRAYYGEPAAVEKLTPLQQSAGSWRDRDFDGAAYVDALRPGLSERLARLGLE